ncbi:MAG: hybrid sensor histidine kinase/response regulator [Chloroflexaceae bacterium]|jgi:signal transduction histidine kinase|nr:hybrid sensor histidine kinase/response regulator [Chloroflexaceae bacterium]
MTNQTNILYIEDNRDNQRLVQRVLGARGYHVHIAEDGTSGITLAQELQPALVLVDINIPGLNGYETTTRLRSMPHLAHVPIVAITADTMSSSRDRALVAGCDGYLHKPIDARQLPIQIAEFLGGRREVVSAPEEKDLLRAYNQELVERLERQVRDLSAANAELAELDRLKGQFLSTLSHELRTPLTALLGYLELFENGALGAVQPQQAEALAVMRRSSLVLSQQLNNLLYFQELRSHQLMRRSINMHETLQPLLAEMRHRATQARLLLHVRLGQMAPLHADPRAMEQAVRGLLDNAIKFSEAGGRIQFTMADTPAGALLRVEDTGIGIPEGALEKIFLPFYQVDDTLARPYPGSGLGLAIVRHIVDAHGGQISVRSELGRGSVFTVLLPRQVG